MQEISTILRGSDDHAKEAGTNGNGNGNSIQDQKNVEFCTAFEYAKENGLWMPDL